MAIKISVPLFRAETERRLIDVEAILKIINRRSRQTVRDWVEDGRLPPPVLKRPQGYALWDRDEVDDYLNGKK
jgi:predicted DNA-binding transcriptional regulator AlpA